MKQKSPATILWELAKKEHSKLKTSVFIASIGVIAGIIPYIAASRILVELLKGNEDFKIYSLWLGIGLLSYILKSFLYSMALSVSHKATFSVLKDVRLRMLEKLPKMPLGEIISVPSGNFKQIIVDQVESMEKPLAHLLPEMTSNLLGSLSIFIYLLFLDWRMALLSLVSIPVGMLFMGLVMKNYAVQYEGSVKVNREMNSAIIEYVNGIEVIKTFNQDKRSYAKYKDKVIANARYFYEWMKSCQLPVSLSKNISPTTMITVLPFGWYFYISGSLSAEVFISVIILSLGIAGPLLETINFVDGLAKIGTIANSINLILEGKEQKHSDREVTIQQYNIDLQNVKFGYEEEKEILHGISLNIKEGTTVAFVGPSGSGKSTLAKLIAGYWDITEGNINIGGYNLNEIPLKQLYSLTAFVSQDNFLFNESIRENIRMGNPSASDKEVEDIAKKSGCHDFIMKMEHGYDTVIGSSGSHVSGGERQRISIARAMLKNAPIVILDEATSYIDPENEVIIKHALSKLIKDKTVIIIAHRLSTITDAEQIFLIENGELVSYGKHDELLKGCELYRNMWNAHIGTKDGGMKC
ncbi:TPA: ABC transporter ATP-binding protein [Streptococcus agalactiae]|uniref:ABC transporter ATP-binding protein n=1 Tax=Streptococcus agalactiae TaxID=1311 RepID=UPI000BAE62D9|nr:ABC transporter ATP-binding protein [Streptococcus agalactiae]ASZ01020.1 ABC transporter, ATP-binding/permease protein [Streptococcus agalactiae]KAF1206773.1 ABC transporter ATP-binding protein [Streptococcus agalactiae]MCA5898344.1 ABC transporter ATP-binding protein/permease [Streptococcus agalactiae]MCA5899939.1 ABC transporter ATP-binding protein/permease [Streptococcus agalactiae]MCA5901748.1 ABC transporter ATP-binding protein/permease [Streptococcus agalactiae]